MTPRLIGLGLEAALSAKLGQITLRARLQLADAALEALATGPLNDAVRRVIAAEGAELVEAGEDLLRQIGYANAPPADAVADD